MSNVDNMQNNSSFDATTRIKAPVQVKADEEAKRRLQAEKEKLKETT